MRVMLHLVPVISLALPLLSPVQDDAREDLLTLERLREISARIETQVSELRGLAFLEPVQVELSDKAKFVAYARRHLESRGGLERLKDEERVAKLLGLLPGDMDLHQVTLDVLTEQVGGFYDPRANTFYIMDTVDEALAEVVIAHEFTHALDDQHHDLDGGADARLDDADALLAHHAVVEGSGMEIMTQWAVTHLGMSKMMKVARAQADLPTEAVAAAPPYVWKPLIAIYLQGQSFLRRQPELALRGMARTEDIEAAFAEPPLSTEQVLHPEKYWDAELRDDPTPIRLAPEGLREGWTLRRQDTVGELHLALATTPFAARGGMAADASALLGMKFTTPAAAGWDGGRYALLSRGEGEFVLQLFTVWDSTEEAAEFAAALEDLIAGIEAEKRREGELPEGYSGVRVRAADRSVTVTSWWGAPEAEAVTAAGSLGWGWTEPGGDESR